MRRCLAGFILCAVIAGCAGNAEDQRAAVSTAHPVMLFALDGLEWEVILPLLAAGELPTLRGLMADGQYGKLRSMNPTLSAVIWTSIATGKTPEKHGIEDFTYSDADATGDRQRYYTSGHRKTKALWNILSDYDRVVHCVGWWITYPAERINGTMVSQTNTMTSLRADQEGLMKGGLMDGVEGQVYPIEYQPRVMTILEETNRSMLHLRYGIFGSPTHRPTTFDKQLWDQSRWSIRADDVYLRVANDILERGEPFDLLAVYLGGTDVLAHRFWRYAYPDQFTHPPTSEQIENFGNTIRDYYRYVDRRLGQLLEMVPDDVCVVVLSDHGMHATNQDRPFSANLPDKLSGHHEDAPDGVFIASGGHVRQGAGASDWNRLVGADIPTLGSVLDVLPTLLRLQGIPLGRDMDGESIERVIDPLWLEETGGAFVDTHDTEEWLEGRSERIRRAIDEEERLEQLRALGYIR